MLFAGLGRKPCELLRRQLSTEEVTDAVKVQGLSQRGPGTGCASIIYTKANRWIHLIKFCGLPASEFCLTFLNQQLQMPVFLTLLMEQLPYFLLCVRLKIVRIILKMAFYYLM